MYFRAFARFYLVFRDWGTWPPPGPPAPPVPVLSVTTARVSGTVSANVPYDVGGGAVTIDIIGTAFTSSSVVADSSGVVAPGANLPLVHLAVVDRARR